MLRLAATSNLDRTKEKPFPGRSLTWLSGDLAQPQGDDLFRQVIRYLAEAVEGDSVSCGRWMVEQRIESLGGLTAEALIEQGLGLLVIDFLLEILDGKRG